MIQLLCWYIFYICATPRRYLDLTSIRGHSAYHSSYHVNAYKFANLFKNSAYTERRQWHYECIQMEIFKFRDSPHHTNYVNVVCDSRKLRVQTNHNCIWYSACMARVSTLNWIPYPLRPLIQAIYESFGAQIHSLSSHRHIVTSLYIEHNIQSNVCMYYVI